MRLATDVRAGAARRRVIAARITVFEKGSPVKMILLRIALIAPLLALAPALSSRAQVTTETPGTPAAESPSPAVASVDVDLGDYTFTLDARYPINVCIIENTRTLDGSRVTYRLFVREQASEGPFYNAVGIYTDSGSGFANADVGECTGMAGVIVDG